jgi:hypothetical protein
MKKEIKYLFAEMIFVIFSCITGIQLFCNLNIERSLSSISCEVSSLKIDPETNNFNSQYLQFSQNSIISYPKIQESRIKYHPSFFSHLNTKSNIKQNIDFIFNKYSDPDFYNKHGGCNIYVLKKILI